MHERQRPSGGSSPYERSSARRSLIDTVAFRALSQIATVLGFIVLVRGMSKEGFGVYNLLYSFVPVVSTVASFGLEQVLRRYQPEYLQGQNKAAANWLVSFIARARFGSNVLVIGIILLAWNYVAPLFKLEAHHDAFLIFCVLMLLHFQARILQLSLGSHMLHRYSVGSTATLAIVKLAAYVVLWWAGELSLQNALIADIAAYAVAWLALRTAYRRHCLVEPAVPAYRPDAGERKRLLRYGVLNNFNDAGTLMLTSRTDNFFIAAMIDPLSVAIYSFYSRLVEMATNLLPARLFDNVVQPMFFAIRSEDAARRVPQFFTLLLNTNLVLMWPLLAYSLAYHAEIVRVVFGGKYVEDSWLLPMMVGFSIVNMAATPITLVAQHQEKAGTILLSKVFGIYGVAAMLVLLPVMGLAGAVVATGTSQLFKNLMIWWYVRRLAVWTNGWSALGSSVLLWGLAVGACILAKTVSDWPAIIDLLVGALVMVAAGLLHCRGPAIAAADRQVLGGMMKGREARMLRLVGLVRHEARS